MMFTNQCHFSFRLKLLSFVHIGSGESRKMILDKKAKAKDEEKKGVDVDCIIRGRDHLPCIPYSSLKGALRTLDIDETKKDILFGPESADSHGRLWIWAGFPDEATVPQNCELPHFGEVEKILENDKEGDKKVAKMSFVLVGTQLDEDLKTVTDGLLYNTEYLPAGIEFSFEGLFLGAADEFQKNVVPLFNSMAAKDGFSVGGQQGYGYGRVRLIEDSLLLQEKALENIQITAQEPTGSVIRLSMCCTGPFLIVDPTRAGGPKEPDLRELTFEGKPVLTGKAIMQELRRRSQWLEVRDLSPDEVGEALGSRVVHFSPKDDPENLSFTERLFGVAGWGKLLRVKKITPKTERMEIYAAHSVALDVLTQGPIDGALMLVECPANIDFEVEIEICQRGCFPLTCDFDHLRKLVEDIAEDGMLEFGHSTGAGFGWFEVDEIRIRGAKNGQNAAE